MYCSRKSEDVALPPVDTSGWTRESLDAEIAAIHACYREVLDVAP